MRRRETRAGVAAAALLAGLAAAPGWAKAGAPPHGTSPKSVAGCLGKAPAAADAAPCQRTIRLRAKILHPKPANDLDALRKELVLKLDALNQPLPAPSLARTDAGGPGQLNLTPGDAAAEAAAARPLCRPTFEMTGSDGSVGFSVRLEQLRGRIASSRAALSALAALAQFYVAHGLAGEALDTVAEAMPAGSMSDDAARLQRDADLARLMKGMQISASSPLLGNPPQCDRPDLGLWQALAAAAAHDAAGVEHAMTKEQGAKGQHALQKLPEPMRDILAYRLADAVDDGSPVLPILADALRDATPATQEDRAAALLLQARLAASRGNPAGERRFLELAVETGRSVPSLQAELRLAELAARGDGPLSARDEARLADFARVYRDSPLGQGAAAELAGRKLRDGDFPASLAIADQSARAGGVQHWPDKMGAEKRGAAMIANILRILLVSPGQARLPPPAARVALYIRYQGYATPGPQGDDIRLGAARLLLAQGLPEAALDAARQLTAPAAASAQGLAVRAQAEAQAGDPAVALDLLRSAPPDDDMHRIAAMALARLARPVEAAHQLDGLTALPDRLQRARLLSEAKAWSDAADAYADLLRDPALAGDARREASDRYGLAVVLSGGHADPGLSLPGNGLAARALAALPSPKAEAGDAAAGEGKSAHGAIAAVRGALQRARAIDTLLPAGTSNQGV
jgi:hypothetical protein